jgi:IclR family transcriptional regulator, mhp operon transcriptional activator
MDSTRPIRALMRGLEALTILNLRDGASVSEIAHAIRLPRTTVYRILETLCDSGYAFRDPTDERYRLTIQVRGLSAGFDDEAWITQIAKPMLFALGDEIVWPLHLATLAGTCMLVRESTDHHSPFAIERYTAGMKLPLLNNSAGRTYLAFCPAAQREALIDMLSRSGKQEDAAARQRTDLARALDEIKSKGFASGARTLRSIDELTLSVPLPLHDRALAVLTVRFNAAALPLKIAAERFLPKLRRCAAKITHSFLEKQAVAPLSSAPQTAA